MGKVRKNGCHITKNTHIATKLIPPLGSNNKHKKEEQTNGMTWMNELHSITLSAEHIEQMTKTHLYRRKRDP